MQPSPRERGIVGVRKEHLFLCDECAAGVPSWVRAKQARQRGRQDVRRIERMTDRERHNNNTHNTHREAHSRRHE